MKVRDVNARIRVSERERAKPAATLKRMRNLADRLMFATNTDPDVALPMCEELAQLVQNLDQHLEKGGSLPSTWRRACRCGSERKR